MKKVLLAFLVFGMSFSSFAQQVDTIFVGGVAGSASQFAYTPDSLVINLGDTVRWVSASGNMGLHPTTATNPSGAFPNFSIQLNTPVNDWVPTAAGTYEYECSSHVQFGMVGKIVVLNSTGIENNLKTEQVKAFPNPSEGLVQVNFGELSVDQVEVYNLVGQQVFTEAVNGQSQITMNLEALPAGSYFYRVIENDKTIVTKKLIIK